MRKEAIDAARNRDLQRELSGNSNYNAVRITTKNSGYQNNYQSGQKEIKARENKTTTPNKKSQPEQVSNDSDQIAKLKQVNKKNNNNEVTTEKV